jgi:hypothetical protein
MSSSFYAANDSEFFTFFVFVFSLAADIRRRWGIILLESPVL